jgi:hypothetical protein
MSYNEHDIKKMEGKCRLIPELRSKGWEIYGHTEAESDPKRDYFRSEYWTGICTKADFTLCIGVSEYDVAYHSGKKEFRYTKTSEKDIRSAKIKALKNMTQENGCTEHEEANAKDLLAKLCINKGSASKKESQMIRYTYPTFQKHPGKGITWHLEKNGDIYAKGTGISKFAMVPNADIFNIDNMKFKDNKKTFRSVRENGMLSTISGPLLEKEVKSIKSFKSFILKIEQIIASESSCGDGTVENNKRAEVQREANKLKKEIEQVVKTGLKFVSKPTPTTIEEIAFGDFVSFYEYNKLKYYAVTGKYIFTVASENFIKISQVGRNHTVLKSGNHKYVNLKQFKQGGECTFCELKKMTEVIEVEKWVKGNSAAS